MELIFLKALFTLKVTEEHAGFQNKLWYVFILAIAAICYFFFFNHLS